jgi:TonB family protein
MFRRLVSAVAALALAAPVLAAPVCAAQPATAPEPTAPQISAPQISPPLTAPLTTQVPAIISMPNWQSLPNANDLIRLYPPAARSRRQSAHVRMQCTVMADGSLADCFILEACPSGLGFEQATLKSAVFFRMRPKTLNGAAVSGGHVIIPMLWQVAGGQPGPRGCPPPLKASN